MSSSRPGPLSKDFSDTAAFALMPDITIPRPPTPEEIRPYRKLSHMEPGAHRRNWASDKDPSPPANFASGKKGVKEPGVDAIFRAEPKSKLGEYIEARNEARYASNKREPLAQVPVLVAKPPKFTEDPEFKFGVKNPAPESSSDLMSPDGLFHGFKKNQATVQQEAEISKPAARNYNWEAAGVDLAHHRFGRPLAATGSAATGVQLAFAEAGRRETHTQIGMKRVEDLKTAQRHVVGRIKNLALQEQAYLSGVAFGGKSKSDEYGAKEIVNGYFSDPRDCLPDPNVGKVRPKRGSELPDSLDLATMTFGNPSIRTDKKAPAVRSVSDPMAYGDEKGAGPIIFPPKFTFDGINPDDFEAARDPADVRSLFDAIGMQCRDDSEFDRVVAAATKNGAAPLSYNTYRDAYNKIKLGL